MKFSCTQENLLQGLQVVSHAAGKNISLPILNNVLIKITFDPVTIPCGTIDIDFVQINIGT